jgi:hypothetical protein
LRIDREAKRWKETTIKHDKMLTENTERVNQILEIRDERQVQPHDLNYLKERVIAQLHQMDTSKKNY